MVLGSRFHLSVSLELSAVFVFVLVFQHGKVAVVAALGYAVLLQGFQYGAAWFMRVCAVAEAAVL